MWRMLSYRQSMLPVTAPLAPACGLTVVTMWSCSSLVKRFTSRPSSSDSSQSSKAPAQEPTSQIKSPVNQSQHLIHNYWECASYQSQIPRECPYLTAIWHRWLRSQSAHQLCRVPRWGPALGHCRSKRTPASSCHWDWRHRAAKCHLWSTNNKKIRIKTEFKNNNGITMNNCLIRLAFNVQSSNLFA